MAWQLLAGALRTALPAAGRTLASPTIKGTVARNAASSLLSGNGGGGNSALSQRQQTSGGGNSPIGQNPQG
jgi:hypothetical protein